MPTNWTKADFDANYRFRLERRMPGGGPRPDEGRNGVELHYHRFFMVPWLADRWATLQPILNILSSDAVMVVGAGFGWGVDAVIAETGATVVGIDLSQYIADEQGNTEETEIRAAIIADGLDPDTGRGAEIFAFAFDNQVRSNVIILQEDAATNGSRQAINTALGGNPSVVVYEDIIDDDWTDTDIINARNAGNGFGGQQRLIFIYKGTAARTHQNLFDLLPGTKEVISTDGQVYLT
jgi:hypothetical protein